MPFVRMLAPLVIVLALLVPAATIWATDDPAITRAAPAAGTGQLREFQLTVQKTMLEVAPGTFVDAYSYNGQVPGPEIRVTVGDTVHVTVFNALDEPTTVHWHGVQLPHSMDGVPGLSQEPIPPGGTFTYEFVADQPGTRWYHSHFKELDQQGSGLFGALIVDPREPTTPPPDREYTLFGNEWVTGVTPGEGQSDHPAGHDMGGAGGGRPVYDLFPINAHVYPSGPPLVVREGERVRLRLINAGATETQKWALAGHQMMLVDSDGNALAQPVPADAVMLGPGERADVEFTADNPGRWQLRGFMPGHFQGGMAVDVVYEGHEQDSVQGFPPGSRPAEVTYAQMSGPPHPVPPDVTYDLLLSDELTSGDFWTINGERYPNTEPLPVVQGQRVRLHMVNLSAEDHPMHLHGHTFQVVAIDGQPVDGPLKDTINIRFNESYDVEFVADRQPGTWLLHCHNIVHMGGGMMTEVNYQPG